MFEASIITYLTEDNTLTGYLSSFNGSPAIFTESAPEEVSINDTYITFYIDDQETDNIIVNRFSVYFDIWSYGESRAKVRNIASRIVYLLGHKHLQSDRFDTIRFFRFSGGPVLEQDPRSIHYNLQMTARAGRKEWADQF